MSIPVIAGPVGYDSWYVKVFRNICEIVRDPKKFLLEWIATEKKLVVHTDRLDDTTSYRITSMLEYTVPAGIKVERYNHTFEISWRDINKYAECVTVDDMLAVNPDYKNDLTSEGEWVYPLPEMVDFASGFKGSSLKKIVAFFPKATRLDYLLKDCKSLEIAKINAPIATDARLIVQYAGKLKEMELIMPSIVKFTYLGTDLFPSNAVSLEKIKVVVPKITGCAFPYNNTKLTVFDAEFPSLVDAPDLCPTSILNAASVIKVLNSLPTWTDGGTHRVMLGIHVDNQSDEALLAAIANAEAKGWTLTVQWNPGGPVYTTPTA